MEIEKWQEEMEDSLNEVNNKLDKVLECLVGDEMGSIGLVKEFRSLKTEVQEIKDSRITEKTESKIYMGIIKWLAAIIAGLVIAYIFNQSVK